MSERRYTKTGRVAHVVTANFFEPSTLVSACGLAADRTWWYGTGSQDEYDRAASLPACRRCEQLGGK